MCTPIGERTVQFVQVLEVTGMGEVKTRLSFKLEAIDRLSRQVVDTPPSKGAAGGGRGGVARGAGQTGRGRGRAKAAPAPKQDAVWCFFL